MAPRARDVKTRSGVDGASWAEDAEIRRKRRAPRLATGRPGAACFPRCYQVREPWHPAVAQVPVLGLKPRFETMFFTPSLWVAEFTVVGL